MPEGLQANCLETPLFNNLVQRLSGDSRCIVSSAALGNSSGQVMRTMRRGFVPA